MKFTPICLRLRLLLGVCWCLCLCLLCCVGTTTGMASRTSSGHQQDWSERFEAIKVLGSGATGVVQLAVEVETNREVVVKILSATPVKEEGGPWKECENAAAIVNRIPGDIRSRYFSRVLECRIVEDISDISYVVMERAGQMSLEDFAKRPETTYDDIRIAMKQVMDALDYLTTPLDRNGMAVTRYPLSFRDLKPENIMHNGKHGHDQAIKFIDFGELTECSSRGASYVNSGSLGVTLPYAAPQIFDVENFLEYPCESFDVFAAGVTLLTILLGQHSELLYPYIDKVTKKHTYAESLTEIFEKDIALWREEDNEIMAKKKEQWLSQLTEDGGLELLKSMLALDHSKRSLIKDIMSHPFLKRAEYKIWEQRTLDDCFKVKNAAFGAQSEICSITVDWDCPTIWEQLQVTKSNLDRLTVDVTCDNGHAVRDVAFLQSLSVSVDVRQCSKCSIGRLKAFCEINETPFPPVLFDRCKSVASADFKAWSGDTSVQDSNRYPINRAPVVFNGFRGPYMLVSNINKMVSVGKLKSSVPFCFRLLRLDSKASSSSDSSSRPYTNELRWEDSFALGVVGMGLKQNLCVKFESSVFSMPAKKQFELAIYTSLSDIRSKCERFTVQRTSSPHALKSRDIVVAYLRSIQDFAELVHQWLDLADLHPSVGFVSPSSRRASSPHKFVDPESLMDSHIFDDPPSPSRERSLAVVDVRSTSQTASESSGESIAESTTSSKSQSSQESLDPPNESDEDGIMMTTLSKFLGDSNPSSPKASSPKASSPKLGSATSDSSVLGEQGADLPVPSVEALTEPDDESTPEPEGEPAPFVAKPPPKGLVITDEETDEQEAEDLRNFILAAPYYKYKPEPGPPHMHMTMDEGKPRVEKEQEKDKERETETERDREREKQEEEDTSASSDKNAPVVSKGKMDKKPRKKLIVPDVAIQAPVSTGVTVPFIDTLKRLQEAAIALLSEKSPVTNVESIYRSRSLHYQYVMTSYFPMKRIVNSIPESIVDEAPAGLKGLAARALRFKTSVDAIDELFMMLSETGSIVQSRGWLIGDSIVHTDEPFTLRRVEDKKWLLPLSGAFSTAVLHWIKESKRSDPHENYRLSPIAKLRFKETDDWRNCLRVPAEFV
eukprot:GILJ01004596.1.p1 GENE.GILJ01004596.1~~GILJ01004596.1.p1  ORF type:complete len:1120 (-),score=157.87 GILJ01004596.1:186-3545(-)